jgi:hypothetical protein
MALFSGRCVSYGLRALVVAVGISTGLPALAPAADIDVLLDEARLVKLPDRVATIIIGNPLIADATVQTGGMMVITGKGYGTTNIIAVDRSGAVLMERTVGVRGPGGGDVVVVYKGVERESYSCMPQCERRLTLGDSATFFEATAAQIGVRNSLAQSGSAPAK